MRKLWLQHMCIRLCFQLDFLARGMFLFSIRLSTCSGDPAGLQPPPLSAPSFGKEGKQIWFQFGADCNLSITLALKTFLQRPEVVEDSRKCYLPCLDDLQSTWWPAISKFLTVVAGELLFHLIWFHRVLKNLIFWIRKTFLASGLLWFPTQGSVC